jgi:hypothetical protein
MTTLHDRLAEVAERAPVGGPPAAELWSRGRRYRRRRRGGIAVVLAGAAVALLALGSVSWQRSAVPLAPAAERPGLPDRLYPVPSDVAGTDQDGPLGRVAVLQQVPSGYVGVSATSGERRRIDLPDARTTNGPWAALSPDGLHLAYWYVDAGARGLAVYDTVTGEVRSYRADVETRRTPVWAGPDVVVFQAGRATLVWDLGDAVPHRVRVGSSRDAPISGVPGKVVVPIRGGYQVLDETTGAVTGAAEAADGLGSTALEPGGPRLAVTATAERLLVGRTDGAPLSEAPVDGEVRAVLGWSGGRVAAVVGPDLVLVDPGTGSRGRLVAGVDDSTQVATDLLGAPTYDAPPPPDRLDRRVVVGGAAGIVLVAALLGLWWWRRARP